MPIREGKSLQSDPLKPCKYQALYPSREREPSSNSVYAIHLQVCCLYSLIPLLWEQDSGHISQEQKSTKPQPPARAETLPQITVEIPQITVEITEP